MFKKWLIDEEQRQEINWVISSNISDLLPLYLIESKLEKEEEEEYKPKHPSYNVIGGGDTNPKTAKHPETNQTYLGAVLHLEPYMASGEQTCPFATAIYKITVKILDPQTMQLIKSTPGYEEVYGNHVFYGFELRSKDKDSGWGKVSDTLLPKDKQAQCPLRMKIRLPGSNLRDWNTGPTIQLNRSDIVHADLVGGCANACLHTSGNPALAGGKLTARRRKTLDLKNDPQGFMNKVLLDVFRLSQSAEKQGHKPVIRLNATSDEAWERDYKFPQDPAKTESMIRTQWPKKLRGELTTHIRKIINFQSSRFEDSIAEIAKYVSGKTLMEVFPEVQYYDYTKNPSRMMQYIRSRNGRTGNWPKNYHLTFSLAEDNREIAKKILADGGTVAAVFNVENNPSKEGYFPKTWAGFPVLNADKHDYRFLDAPGHIAGLRAKGEAKFQSTDFGFVIQPDDPDLDPEDPAVIQAKKYSDNFERRISSGELKSRPGAIRGRMRAAGKATGNVVLY